MSEPQHEVIHSESPAHFDWDVVARWHGLRDGRYYPSPVACFANNNSCEIALVRNPFAHPVTKSDTRPVRADLDAGHSAHDGSDPNAGADPDADLLRGDVAGGAGDGDSPRSTHHLRADNRDTGGEQDMLLGSGPADAESDADAATVRDARPCDAMYEDGELT